MNNTLYNGLELLELLAENSGESAVSELAALTGRPTSTICRILKTLVRKGYAEQNRATRKYRVSLKVLNLAHARLGTLDFRRLGRPYAAQLAARFDSPTYLTQPLQGRSIVVDVAFPDNALTDPGIVIGCLHHVRRSACGKLCAAYANKHDQSLLTQVLATEEPCFDQKLWAEELHLIKHLGISVRREEGILAAAAPVLSAGGKFCGALGIMLLHHKEIDQEVEQELKQAAQSISFALGYPVSH